MLEIHPRGQIWPLFEGFFHATKAVCPQIENIPALVCPHKRPPNLPRSVVWGKDAIKAIQAKYKASIRQLLDLSAPPIPETLALGADITILEASVAFIADQLKHHGKKAEETAEFSLRPVVAMFGRRPAEGAELGRLVEVKGKADFVADLGVSLDEPGIRRVGQDFAFDEGFDAALLQQRDLLEVA